MLVGAAALALLGAASTACGPSAPPPDLAELTAQRDRAEADGRLAAAAAAAAPPPVAPALTTVASERSAHARALSDEITRITGATTTSATATDTTVASAGATPTSTGPTPAPTPADVVAALRTSADSAAQLTVQLAGYRAGLLGSIAAACTAGYRVALAGTATTTTPPPTPTTTPPTPAPSPEDPTTSAATPSLTAEPDRPSDPAAGAWFDAIATEHGVIYGYGLVSAHSTTDVNDLVSAAMAEHRERREAAIARFGEGGLAAPLPAAGYQLPAAVTDPADAATLAVRMEKDAAVAWRAVLEQATTSEDRSFALTALTQSAVAAARWNQVLGVLPITVAFPGGSE